MTEQEMLDLLDLVMKQQNLLNLLKEKKVDLDYINEMLKYEEEAYVDRYNHYLKFYPSRHLTEEEMNLIINWLKEE